MYKYLPILIIIFSNIVYHTCTKSIPAKLDPIASLTITYTVAALTSFILFFITHHGKAGQLAAEYSRVNYTSLLIGLAVIGIDFGNRYMYKVGWSINSGYLTQSILLSISLIVVGQLFYHEVITVQKVIGVVFCIIGIVFINR